MDERRKQIEVAKQYAYSLKSKSAQRKAWDMVRGLEDDLLILLYAERDKYAPFSVQGVVGHFHDGAEYVFVKLSDGTTTWVCPTNDAISRSWYSTTCCVSYEAGQSVVIEFDVDVDLDRLYLCRVPKRIYGGTLNEAKFQELDKRTDLAFFKHSTGGMTGLFSSEGV